MAKWWEKLVDPCIETDDPEVMEQVRVFNEAASRLYNQLPKSERRVFFEMLKAAYVLHAHEGYRCWHIGYEYGAYQAVGVRVSKPN